MHTAYQLHNSSITTNIFMPKPTLNGFTTISRYQQIQPRIEECRLASDISFI